MGLTPFWVPRLSLPLQAPSNLVSYGADQINTVWWQVEPLIQRALDRGSIYTIDEIYDALRSREMQLWAWVDEDIEACLVTAIQYTDTTFCLLLALGGKSMDLWSRFLPLVEDWARDQGATEMRIYGRAGWAKVTGYNIDYTRLSKRL